MKQLTHRCAKLDECQKIKMILDKDILESQAAEAIRTVCEKCDEFVHDDTAVRLDQLRMLREVANSKAKLMRVKFIDSVKANAELVSDMVKALDAAAKNPGGKIVVAGGIGDFAAGMVARAGLQLFAPGFLGTLQRIGVDPGRGQFNITLEMNKPE